MQDVSLAQLKNAFSQRTCLWSVWCIVTLFVGCVPPPPDDSGETGGESQVEQDRSRPNFTFPDEGVDLAVEPDQSNTESDIGPPDAGEERAEHEALHVGPRVHDHLLARR